MYIGKPVSSRMLSAVRRLCGQLATAPTAVADQSIERMSAPISPPPASGSVLGTGLGLGSAWVAGFAAWVDIWGGVRRISRRLECNISAVPGRGALLAKLLHTDLGRCAPSPRSSRC